MDLGNIFTVAQFNRSEQTTWIMDKFYKNFVTQEVYDTVKLKWVLSILENEVVYPISFFIKHDVSNCSRRCEEQKFNKRFCGTTFSILKHRYVGYGFNASKCSEDILLNKIYTAFLHNWNIIFFSV